MTRRRGPRRPARDHADSGGSRRDVWRFAPITVLLLASAALGVALAIAGDRDVPESDIATRPIRLNADGYVSSDTCKACHPSEYETWYGSFHRTMTQVATPDSVRADFDGVRVENTHGQPMFLERDGDTFWAEFDDPGWEGADASRPRIRRQVVMITGSHHQNIYWYETGHDRGLNVLPSVYLIEEEQWAPRSAVVLHPPNQSLAMLNGHWNAICIVCHTTHGKTAFDTPYRSEPFETQAVDTTVAEFGIACEACHGPAQEHIAANKNPLRRYGLYLSDEDDSTIVEPSLLDPQRSSQVCGQCHSVWEFYDLEGERRANRDGLPFRPSDDLRTTRFVAQPSVDRSSPEILALVDSDPEFVRGSFWPDGMVRVSGREYNGLLDSPCFRDASDPEHTLSCFSCHTMHKTAEDPRSISEWADTHQVSTDMNGNDACLQCHDTMRDDVTTHTRHLAESSGSSCYNCHMPYTAFGLLKAERSHTISSPSAAETAELGRPNACNLCHLDKTLGWTADRLNDWYDTPEPVLSVDDRRVAASLLWMLRGDAGLRALTAQSMGWAPAQEVSGTSWMVPHLGEALGDGYDAVRFIAVRSLRSLPGYADLAYDFVGPGQERIDTAVRVLREWRASPTSRQRREPELLVDTEGALRVGAMRRLFDQRDRRPLFLRE
jgi:hypothetical protein